MGVAVTVRRVLGASRCVGHLAVNVYAPNGKADHVADHLVPDPDVLTALGPLAPYT
jgi:hypothetical protein